ncbi:type II secretion system protein GspK [Taklimakanibacter lacteus]|uniref:type II secretion system protein GspK n=1 Tax=Taklimakanibacter lacteus TaxID=2268456 RepID=UPI0013C3F93F
MMNVSRSSRDGFVLFSVIWIAGLLAVISTTFAISTRLHVKSQANLTYAYQVEVLADGMVRAIGHQLAQMRPSDTRQVLLPASGQAVSCAVDENIQAVIVLQDQAGLIDLNQTSPAVLTGVLSRLGVAQAEQVSEAIVDFRDQDETRFDGGGEEIGLVAHGPGLKNAAFQSIDEMAQAIPETLADLSELESLFTVYSLQEGIDPSVAPEKLRGLVEVSPSSAAENGRLPTTLSPRKAFAIDVKVKLASGIAFRRVAVITLLRLPERPFAILEWRQSSDVDAERPAVLISGPCATFLGHSLE